MTCIWFNFIRTPLLLLWNSCAVDEFVPLKRTFLFFLDGWWNIHRLCQLSRLAGSFFAPRNWTSSAKTKIYSYFLFSSRKTGISLNNFIAGKMDKCELVSFRLGRWMRHVDFICHESPLPKSLRLDKLDIVRAILFAGFVFFNAPFFIVSFSLPVCVCVCFFSSRSLAFLPLLASTLHGMWVWPRCCQFCKKKNCQRFFFRSQRERMSCVYCCFVRAHTKPSSRLQFSAF